MVKAGRIELEKNQKSEGYKKPEERPKKKDELAKALRANLLRRKAASAPRKGGG